MASSTSKSQRLRWLKSFFTKRGQQHWLCNSNTVLPIQYTDSVHSEKSEMEIAFSNSSNNFTDSFPTNFQAITLFDNHRDNENSARSQRISSAPVSTPRKTNKRRNQSFSHTNSFMLPVTPNRNEGEIACVPKKHSRVIHLSDESQHTSLEIPDKELENRANLMQRRVLGCSQSENDKDASSVSSASSGHISNEGTMPKSNHNSDTPGPQIKPSKYLQLYYDKMYYTCFCTYMTREDALASKPIWCLLVSIIQKVPFWFIAILSGFQSICLAKHSFLRFIDGGGYISFVSFAHHFACLLAKAYAVNLFAFEKTKTVTMLREMDTYEESCYYKEKCGQSKKLTPWKQKLVTLVIVSTLTLGLIKALVDADSTEELVLNSSLEFSQDLFIWGSKNMENLTTVLEEKYGKNITSTAIAFSIIVISRDAASYMTLGIIFDLVILVAAVMYSYTKAFIKEVKQVTPNAPRENSEECHQLQSRREAIWKIYRTLRVVIMAVNDVFDPLLKLLHGGNLLLFAFFMILCVFTESTYAALFLYALYMAKTEVAYYIAGRIAEANDIIRAWLRNWALYTGKIKVGKDEMDITVILDELDKEPLGLGKGKFLIHHSFHFKFLGLVGSVFFSMADEAKKE